MKFNALFVAAICAGTLLNSCVHKTAQENQLKYTHTSLADGDAFSVIHKVGETAMTGAKHAEHAEGSSKEVADKVKSFYAQLLPALDSLATAFHVDFPIKGVPSDDAVAATADSTADSVSVATHEHDGGHHADYAHEAQHEIALIKEQLTRLTRNTNKEMRAFAEKQLSIASELYTAIGGKEDAHAHHH